MEWKDVPEYEGLYQINILGEVKSLKKNIILKQRICPGGYYMVDLYKNGKRKTIRIHQLLGIVFLGHIPNKYELVIDHIDNNKLNNSLENLQIISQRENSSKDTKLKQTSSKYIGVHLNRKTNKWHSTIRINGKKVFLGSFLMKRMLETCI